MIYIDFSIQTSPANMDTILSDMQHVSSSLGQFLQELFRHPHKGSKDNDPARSQRHKWYRNSCRVERVSRRSPQVDHVDYFQSQMV